MGVTAQELGELQENDNDAYLEKFGDATFKSFIFKIRVKLETFSVSLFIYQNICNLHIDINDRYLQDEKRLKATCAAVSPMDYKTYNNHLITQIKELSGIDKI